ncbi:hypothetical protein CEP52_006475 [Fusarium oligoseptatum]|uniref:Uncharacterized protein n=1 Tax=Fusarium oligoseptatum TaxID=2604345 RepID=A0A428TSJ3_9HYPO|nr:hypothetical protein CEP52_006475 [Fusarium oligoseptatum]
MTHKDSLPISTKTTTASFGRSRDVLILPRVPFIRSAFAQISSSAEPRALSFRLALTFPRIVGTLLPFNSVDCRRVSIRLYGRGNVMGSLLR